MHDATVRAHGTEPENQQAAGESNSLNLISSDISFGKTLQIELGIIRALWRRELLHLLHQRSRWLGVVLQPLLFWFIIGSGMAPSFKVDGLSENDYLQFLFPGIVVMVILFTAIFATISVIEDRKTGFLQGVLVAPGSRLAMVLGKVSGVTSLVLVQVALMLAVAPFAGFPLTEISWGSLLLITILSTMGLTGIGIAMAWHLNSAQAYHAMMSIVLLPLWIVSGAMFPVSGTWVQWLAYVNPMNYSVNGLRNSLLGLDINPVDGLALLLFGALVLWVAHRACKRSAPRA